MHPFLNSGKLTDEQIIEKLGRAYEHMNYQKAIGHNATVQSIQDVIQDLEDERARRMTKHAADEFARKYPNDKNPIELGKLDN